MKLIIQWYLGSDKHYFFYQFIGKDAYGRKEGKKLNCHMLGQQY